MRLLRLALLLALAPIALAQTSTPPPPAASWISVANEDGGTQIVIPAGTVIRWCDAATGRTCSPAETFTAAATITAYCPTVPACNADDATDGLSGISKIVEVKQTFATQDVTVNGVVVHVEALTPPTYPPITFTPGNVVQIVYGGVSILPHSALDQMLNGAASPLPPYELVGVVLQNFIFKLKLTDQVTKATVIWDCTFGQMALDGTVSENCTTEPVQAPAQITQ